MSLSSHGHGYGEDYQRGNPICHVDEHECDSVALCRACDGEMYCDEHLAQCAGCKQQFCTEKHPLVKTDCGLLCARCEEVLCTDEVTA